MRATKEFVLASYNNSGEGQQKKEKVENKEKVRRPRPEVERIRWLVATTYICTTHSSWREDLNNKQTIQRNRGKGTKNKQD